MFLKTKPATAVSSWKRRVHSAASGSLVTSSATGAPPLTRSPNFTPSSVFGQTSHSGNALSTCSSGASGVSRGEATIDTRSRPSSARPLGSTVQTIRCWAIRCLLRERFAVVAPGVLRAVSDGRELAGERQRRIDAHQVAEARVAVRAGKLLLAGDGDAGREHEDLDLDRQARRADAFPALELVAQLEIQLERRGDEAEHADVAAEPEIARQRTGALLHPEVDARHDLHAARGDAEIDRDAGAELERRLEDLDAMRIERDAEESAAAEERHRQVEGLLARAEVEADAEGLADERHREAGAEAQVGQAEHADRDVRQREREAGVDALRRDVEERRIREAIERDQIAQRLDETERSDELDVGQQDVDVHLRAGVDLELDLLEIELDEARRRDQDQVEALQAADDGDLRRARSVLLDLGLDGDEEAVLVVGAEECVGRRVGAR